MMKLISIIEQLKMMNIKYYFIGGCVRDYYYGLDIHDYDIWIEPLSEDEQKRLIERINPDVIKVIEKPDFTDKYSLLLKFDNIDIIISKDNSVFDTINKFDANINQWVLIGNKAIFAGDKHPDSYGLVILSQTLPDKRVRHLNSIYSILRKSVFKTTSTVNNI